MTDRKLIRFAVRIRAFNLGKPIVLVSLRNS
jgi:hypothetical protein